MLKPQYRAVALVAASLYLMLLTSSFRVKPFTTFIVEKAAVEAKPVETSRYDAWQLSAAGVSKEAFEAAYKGFEYLKKRGSLLNSNILTVIDFSKSSAQKRLFIIDLINGKLLMKSLVAHGKNSGNEYANAFSNLNESHQSSLGFYVTMDTYTGGHGYSLKLKGCEKGINDAAYTRDIVMHSADYVSEAVVRSRGCIGRSFGCPAIPKELNENIINLVKNGSCMFIYHPTKTYLTRSEILNG